MMNLHTSKRMGASTLGISALQTVKSSVGMKMHKGHEMDTGHEQKIGMLRQRSNVLGESLKDIGGRHLFADE